MKKLAAVVAGTAALFAATIASAPSASADRTYSCSTDGGHLVGRATRVDFGGGKSAIVGQMTSYHQHDVPFGTDRVYRPHMFKSSTGLQTRYYTSKTTWGSVSNPLDFSTEIITMYWYGETVHGQPIAGKYCTVKVGV